MQISDEVCCGGLKGAPNNFMIHGVVIKKLVKHSDERGFLVEIIRSDDDFYEGFGQVYISACYPDQVKAWHYHKKQNDKFCVIKGAAKIMLWDGRNKSPTKGKKMEILCNERKLQVIHIPAGVLHGYKTVGNKTAYVLNLIKRPYNHAQPDEYRVDFVVRNSKKKKPY